MLHPVATPRQAACSAMTLRGQPPPVQTFLHPFGWPLSGHPTCAEHALHVSLQQQHVHTMRECEKSLGQRLPIWLGDGVLISTTNTVALMRYLHLAGQAGRCGAARA
jgi:hypothetical protein